MPLGLLTHYSVYLVYTLGRHGITNTCVLPGHNMEYIVLGSNTEYIAQGADILPRGKILANAVSHTYTVACVTLTFQGQVKTKGVGTELCSQNVMPMQKIQTT